MSEAPERIWLDWPGSRHGEPFYTEPPETDTQAGQTEYIRADIARALTAENNRLREALKPFADEAEHWETWVADESLVEWFPEYDGNENPITVGDLRNARAALKGQQP